MFMFCWNDAMHYHQIIVEVDSGSECVQLLLLLCAFWLPHNEDIYYLHQNTIMSAIKLIELYYLVCIVESL